jgi:hypothetical protein
MYSTGETHIKGMIGNGMRVLGILTNICICICVYIYMYMCIYIYIYIYVGGTIDLVAIAA